MAARLNCVNGDEDTKCGGEEAERALSEKVHGKQVKVVIMDVDRYRRMVGILLIGNTDINREMVQEGFAWAYRE